MKLDVSNFILYFIRFFFKFYLKNFKKYSVLQFEAVVTLFTYIINFQFEYLYISYEYKYSPRQMFIFSNVYY